VNKRKKVERMKRVEEMNRVLRQLYKRSKVELNYTNEWELMVAVQLSAQCTDKRVNETTAKLFKKYRTLNDYADAKEMEFEKAIYACGFYRNKTKNIIKAARMVRDEYGGRLPHTMEELLKLPGVARKTANVVLSNAHGVHEGIAVDTHVRRFAIRFDLSDYTDPVRIERDLMEIMPQSYWWGFNHRLVQYGRDYCSARKHDCTDHPLTKIYPKAMSPRIKFHLRII